mmetsp:Transcript_17498/g.40765  ORF Transcript_17498/g.40765 Transcript_17498/m.40765 type:complete len:197 (+) Transcript_17498:92-682(+)
MADAGLSQILALLILDTDGERLAVKYSSVAKKELWPGTKAQLAFEKRLIAKLPKPTGTGGRGDVDVAIIDEYTVLYQSCNDVVVCAIASASENELVVMQLVEGVYAALSNSVQSSFLATGLTKQIVLDNLSDVFFILDEVTDDAIIMETEEEKIVARIKMQDETEVSNSAQAEKIFNKATESAKNKLLASFIGGRG